MAKKPKSKLPQEAKGRECQIRIPGICNKDRETVVLCHLNNKRLFGVGTGEKVPDIFAAHGCSACHDVVDGRRPVISNEDMTIMHMEGVFRTMNILLAENKIRT